ncbi:histone-lysine N-methyltransferase, H3 lysine-9 specific SUVH6 [Trifolium repens]|nr:histone-lysine N-methyltransferase, H3 lysine-9 specific SUVH6 [Trifolium repens]
MDGKSKTYGYDGLYLVESCWPEMGSHGKLVYKFRLRRIPEVKTIMMTLCYNPKSLFPLPPDASSHLLDSFNFVKESSDQDLLLDVPSNSSFPQEELLHPNLSYGAQASTSSSSACSHLVK